MTQTELTHGEAWLLETAVSFHLSIASLTSRNLGNWLNRGEHRLSPPELRQTLRRMFDQGDIEAFNSSGDTRLRPPDATFFCPSDSQLNNAISSGDKNLSYRLTVQGATRWESLARPDWDRYYRQRSAGNQSYEIIAGSRGRLLELIRESKTVWNVIMSEADLEVETLEPWRIANWKSLPRGYRAIVSFSDGPWLDEVLEDMGKSNEEKERDRESIRRKYIRLRHWADSICGRDFV